jgi:hypothetical protein
MVLGKLALGDLARAAPMCRAFRQAFASRLADERVRRVSTAEETYGKEMFSGFVTAFNCYMEECEAYPGLRAPDEYSLVIKADGEAEYVSSEEVAQRIAGDGPVIHMCKTSHLELYAELSRKVPGGSKVARIKIEVRMGTEYDEEVIDLAVEVNREAAMAATGVILAICAGSPEANPSSWYCPLERITLTVNQEEGAVDLPHDVWGAAEKEEAQDLVWPLRSLGKLVTLSKVYGELPSPSVGSEKGPDQSAAHLHLLWFA